MPKSEFLTLEIKKNQKRSKLKCIESEISLVLSTIHQRIEHLRSIHQSQVL